MAIKAHIENLNERHNALKAEISEEVKHPAMDMQRIIELKRRKLKIKDEIEDIRTKLEAH